MNKFLVKIASGNWIQGAIKKPGSLHRELGIPQGEKIPKSTLDTAAEKGGKLGQRARLAETLEKISSKRKLFREVVGEAIRHSMAHKDKKKK